MALIAGISHDLRTYATRLRLRTEFIADEGERAKAVQDLDDMRRLGLIFPPEADPSG